MQPCSELPYYGLNLNTFFHRFPPTWRTHIHTRDAHKHTYSAFSVDLILFHLCCSAPGAVSFWCAVSFACKWGFRLSAFILSSVPSRFFLKHSFSPCICRTFSLNPGSHHYSDSLMKSLSDFAHFKKGHN